MGKISTSLIVLALILATEPLYRESLYSYSLEWIPTIRRAASPFQQTFWRLYSDLALFCSFGLPCLYSMFIKGDRAMAVYYAIVIAALTFSMNFLKLRFHDPRPFWSSEDVQAF